MAKQYKFRDDRDVDDVMRRGIIAEETITSTRIEQFSLSDRFDELERLQEQRDAIDEQIAIIKAEVRAAVQSLGVSLPPEYADRVKEAKTI